MDSEAFLVNENSHGKIYRVDISITGVMPGQEETVRTGWTLDTGKNIVRLTTLYVIGRKK